MHHYCCCIPKRMKFVLLQILTIFISHGMTLKVDGFSSHVALEGSKAILRCNTTAWSEDLTVIIWFRGLSGQAIYSYDRRSSFERMHLKGDPPPPPPSSSVNQAAADASRSSSVSSSLPVIPHRLDPESVSFSSLSSFDQEDAASTDAFPERERLFVDRSDKIPSLVIDPVQPQDVGDYRCRVDARSSRTKNYVVTLQVIVPPKELTLVDANGHRVGRIAGPYDEASDLIIFCRAFGKPAPVLKWWSSDGVLLEDNYFLSSNGISQSELHLTNLNRSNLMSELICKASNTNLTQEISASTFIDLNLKPLQVKLIPPRSSIIAGKRIEFKCQSVGSRPKPQISWFKGDNSAVPLTEVLESHSTDSNTTISTVSFVPDISDNGKHLSCRSENPAIGGSALEEGIRLHVSYIPRVRIVLGARIDPHAIIEGMDMFFECIVNANPGVTEVSWFFEGSLMSSDPSSGIIISNQSLVLQRVRRTSRGRYWCSSANSAGRGESDEFFLKVLFAPVCKKSQKTTYGAGRNEVIHVTCDVDSDPRNVTFKWFFDNFDARTEVRSFTSTGNRSIASLIPSSSSSPSLKLIASNSSPTTASVPSESLPNAVYLTTASSSVSSASRQGSHQSHSIYGKMLCMAENTIGKMRDPCVFTIIPSSPPEAVYNCSVRNASVNLLLVSCKSGDSVGLKQTFHLEVYNEQKQLHANFSTRDLSSLSLSDSSSSGTSSESTSSSYMDADGPNFVIPSLPAESKFTLHIYARNSRGRSPVTLVSVSSFTQSEKQTHAPSETSIKSVTTGMLIAAGFIVSIITVLFLVCLIRIRSFSSNKRQKRERPVEAPQTTLTGSPNEQKAITTSLDHQITSVQHDCKAHDTVFISPDLCRKEHSIEGEGYRCIGNYVESNYGSRNAFNITSHPGQILWNPDPATHNSISSHVVTQQQCQPYHTSHSSCSTADMSQASYNSVNTASGHRYELHVSFSPEVLNNLKPVQYTQLDAGCQSPSSSSGMDHSSGFQADRSNTRSQVTTSPRRHHVPQQLANPYASMHRKRQHTSQDYHQMHHITNTSPAPTPVGTADLNSLATVVSNAPNRSFLNEQPEQKAQQ